MGVHRDAWANDVITKIRDLGKSLGYVTALKEKRTTRGWIDVCWIWNVPIIKEPIFLLVAEIETSKSDWPRIRSNAAKAVELKPLIYAQIFKPNIRLTSSERRQLLEIHHGRHTLLFDGTSDFKEFLNKLRKFGQYDFRDKLCAFTFVRCASSRDYLQTRKFLSRVPGAVAVYELFGMYDFLAVFPLEDRGFKKLSERIQNLHATVAGRLETSTFIAFKNLLNLAKRRQVRREPLTVGTLEKLFPIQNYIAEKK